MEPETHITQPSREGVNSFVQRAAIESGFDVVTEDDIAATAPPYCESRINDIVRFAAHYSMKPERMAQALKESPGEFRTPPGARPYNPFFYNSPMKLKDALPGNGGTVAFQLVKSRWGSMGATDDRLEQARERIAAFVNQYGEKLSPWFSVMRQRAKSIVLGEIYGQRDHSYENMLFFADFQDVEFRVLESMMSLGWMPVARVKTPWFWQGLRAFIMPVHRHFDELCVWHLAQCYRQQPGLNNVQMRIAAACEFGLRKVIAYCRQKINEAKRRQYDELLKEYEVVPPPPEAGPFFDVTFIHSRKK